MSAQRQLYFMCLVAIQRQLLYDACRTRARARCVLCLLLCTSDGACARVLASVLIFLPPAMRLRARKRANISSVGRFMVGNKMLFEKS